MGFTVLSPILWGSKRSNSLTASQRMTRHFPNGQEEQLERDKIPRGPGEVLWGSFSSAQGHKFMDTTWDFRVEKLTANSPQPLSTRNCHHLRHASFDQGLLSAELRPFCVALKCLPGSSLLREGRLGLLFLIHPDGTISLTGPVMKRAKEDAKWRARRRKAVRTSPEQAQALLSRNWGTGETDRSWAWRGELLGEFSWFKTSLMVIAIQRSAAKHMHEKQDKIKSSLVSYRSRRQMSKH